jgi:hypothetical protein
LAVQRDRNRNIGGTTMHGNQNQGGGHGKKGSNKLTRSYTPAEWRALSKDERKHIIQARNKAKANRDKKINKDGDGNNKQNGEEHSVSAVETDADNQDDEASYFDMTADNEAETLRRKNISVAHTETAGNFMSSRNLVNTVGKKFNKKTRISMISTRCISADSRNVACVRSNRQRQDSLRHEKCELDSQADTCCVGSTFKVIKYTGQVCNVYPYSPKYKPRTDIPVVKAVTAYDHPYSETFILCLNQALYFRDEMPNSVLNQNQLRYHGKVVNDCPTFLSPNHESPHSIYFPDSDLHLPLFLNGCISYLPTRIPTKCEIDEGTWLNLTSDEIHEPYSKLFEEQESIVHDK